MKSLDFNAIQGIVDAQPPEKRPGVKRVLGDLLSAHYALCDDLKRLNAALDRSTTLAARASDCDPSEDLVPLGACVREFNAQAALVSDLETSAQKHYAVVRALTQTLDAMGIELPEAAD